jgi:16S rRNA (guanine966-N2)-methyltransferase
LGFLRIIAGEFKGRRIRVAAGAPTRPTAERAREALFSIVGPGLADTRVLHAYSGSGALGFEALSRGAREVVFVDADPRTVRGLRATAEALGAGDRSVVVLGAVSDALGAGAVVGPFDLILADPPYAGEERGQFLGLIVERGLLTPGGRVVIERDRRATPENPALPGLRLARSERYGRCTLDFYDFQA